MNPERGFGPELHQRSNDLAQELKKLRKKRDSAENSDDKAIAVSQSKRLRYANKDVLEERKEVRQSEKDYIEYVKTKSPEKIRRETKMLESFDANVQAEMESLNAKEKVLNGDFSVVDELNKFNYLIESMNTAFNLRHETIDIPKYLGLSQVELNEVAKKIYLNSDLGHGRKIWISKIFFNKSTPDAETNQIIAKKLFQKGNLSRVDDYPFLDLSQTSLEIDQDELKAIRRLPVQYGENPELLDRQMDDILSGLKLFHGKVQIKAMNVFGGDKKYGTMYLKIPETALQVLSDAEQIAISNERFTKALRDKHFYNRVEDIKIFGDKAITLTHGGGEYSATSLLKLYDRDLNIIAKKETQPYWQRNKITRKKGGHIYNPNLEAIDRPDLKYEEILGYNDGIVRVKAEDGTVMDLELTNL